MAATEPIRDKNQLRDMAEFYRSHGQFRNYALIVMGACTALRISDLLKLQWDEVYSEATQSFNSHIILREQKTGKEKEIALCDQVKTALRIYLPYRKGRYIFASRNAPHDPIVRSQAWRIIREAAVAVGATGKISCHSLRKTFGYHAWNSGVSPVVLMDIYNHSSYDVTKRYLGVAQDDLDKAYLGIDLF